MAPNDTVWPSDITLQQQALDGARTLLRRNKLDSVFLQVAERKLAEQRMSAVLRAIP